MTKEKLLSTIFPSAFDAMKALEKFLLEVDSSCEDETRSDYQDLRVIGNRIIGS